MDSMEEDYRRDYDFKGECDNAVRSLESLLENAGSNLGGGQRTKIEGTRDMLKREADLVVAVWN